MHCKFGSQDDKVGGFWAVYQLLNIFQLVAQDKFDLLGGAVAATNPDDFGWGTIQQG